MEANFLIDDQLDIDSPSKVTFSDYYSTYRLTAFQRGVHTNYCGGDRERKSICQSTSSTHTE